MRVLSIVLFGCLVPLLTSCSSGSGSKSGPGGDGGTKQKAVVDTKLKELIVGKWEVVGASHMNTYEFLADGNYKFSEVKPGGIPGGTLGGKYKIMDDGETVEMTITEPADLGASQHKAKVAGDELTLTDAKGKSEKYKRMN